MQDSKPEPKVWLETVNTGSRCEVNVRNQSHINGQGKNENEAVGDLVRNHPDIFNVAFAKR
jgi:hypothetical protein